MGIFLTGLMLFSTLELRVELIDTLFYPREQIFLDVTFINHSNDTVWIFNLPLLKYTPEVLRFHVKNEKGESLIRKGPQLSYILPPKKEGHQPIAPRDSLTISGTLNGRDCWDYVSPGREKKWIHLINPGIYQGYAIYHWTAKTSYAIGKPEDKEILMQGIPVFKDSIQSNPIRFRILPVYGVDSIALEEYTKAIYHNEWCKEDSAIIVCRGILSKYPNSPYAPLAQKLICELSRRKMEYEKFIRLFPDHHFVPIMLRKMKGLYSKEGWVEYLNTVIRDYPETIASKEVRRLLKEGQ